jgi:uncharacterized protein YukE
MSIFSFAEEIVDNAVSIVSSAINQIGDVQQNIVSDFDPIVNGAWIGQGSTAFQQEVTGELLPAIQALSQTTTAALSLAKEVADQIKEADSFLDNLFGFVEDVFDAITPW